MINLLHQTDVVNPSDALLLHQILSSNDGRRWQPAMELMSERLLVQDAADNLRASRRIAADGHQFDGVTASSLSRGVAMELERHAKANRPLHEEEMLVRNMRRALEVVSNPDLRAAFPAEVRAMQQEILSGYAARTMIEGRPGERLHFLSQPESRGLIEAIRSNRVGADTLEQIMNLHPDQRSLMQRFVAEIPASRDNVIAAGQIATILNLPAQLRREFLPGGRAYQPNMTIERAMDLARHKPEMIKRVLDRVVDSAQLKNYARLQEGTLEWALRDGNRNARPTIERIMAQPDFHPSQIEVLRKAYPNGMPDVVKRAIDQALVQPSPSIGSTALAQIHRLAIEHGVNAEALVRRVLEGRQEQIAQQKGLPRSVFEQMVWHAESPDHLQALYETFRNHAADSELAQTMDRLAMADATSQRELAVMMQRGDLDYRALKVLSAGASDSEVLRNFRRALEDPRNGMSREMFQQTIEQMHQAIHGMPESQRESAHERAKTITDVLLPGRLREGTKLAQEGQFKAAFERVMSEPDYAAAHSDVVARANLTADAHVAYSELNPSLQKQISKLLEKGFLSGEFADQWLLDHYLGASRSEEPLIDATTLNRYELRAENLKQAGIDPRQVAKHADFYLTREGGKHTHPDAFDLASITALTGSHDSAVELYLKTFEYKDFGVTPLKDALILAQVMPVEREAGFDFAAFGREVKELQGQHQNQPLGTVALAQRLTMENGRPLAENFARAERLRGIYEHTPELSFEQAQHALDVIDAVVPEKVSSAVELTGMLAGKGIHRENIELALRVAGRTADSSPTLFSRLQAREPKFEQAVRLGLMREFAQRMETLNRSPRDAKVARDLAVAIGRELTANESGGEAHRQLIELTNASKRLQTELLEGKIKTRLEDMPAREAAAFVEGVEKLAESKLGSDVKALHEAQDRLVNLLDVNEGKTYDHLKPDMLEVAIARHREQLRRRALGSERTNPAEIPQTFRSINKVVDGLNGREISDAMVQRALERLTPAERVEFARRLEQRASFHSLKAMGEHFDALKQELLTQGESSRFTHYKVNRGNLVYEINGLTLGESGVGHQLAYHFYKSAHVSNDLHRLEISGEHLLLVDANGRKRAIEVVDGPGGKKEVYSVSVEYEAGIKGTGGAKDVPEKLVLGKDRLPLNERFVLWDNPNLPQTWDHSRASEGGARSSGQLEKLRTTLDAMKAADRLLVPEKLTGSLNTDGHGRLEHSGFAGDHNFMDLGRLQAGGDPAELLHHYGFENKNAALTDAPVTHEELDVVRRALRSPEHIYTEAKILSDFNKETTPIEELPSSAAAEKASKAAGTEAGAPAEAKESAEGGKKSAKREKKTRPWTWNDIVEQAAVYGNAISYRQTSDFMAQAKTAHEAMLGRLQASNKDLIFVVMQKEGSAYYLHEAYRQATGVERGQFYNQHELMRMAADPVESAKLKDRTLLHADDAFDHGADCYEKESILSQIQSRAKDNGNGMRQVAVVTNLVFDHDAPALEHRPNAPEAGDRYKYFRAEVSTNLPERIRQAQRDGLIPEHINPDKYAVSAGEKRGSLEKRAAAGEVWAHLVPNDTEHGVESSIRSSGHAGTRVHEAASLYLPFTVAMPEYLSRLQEQRITEPRARAKVLEDVLRTVISEGRLTKPEHVAATNALANKISEARQAAGDKTLNVLHDIHEYSLIVLGDAIPQHQLALAEVKRAVVDSERSLKGERESDGWSHSTLNANQVLKLIEKLPPKRILGEGAPEFVATGVDKTSRFEFDRTLPIPVAVDGRVDNVFITELRRSGKDLILTAERQVAGGIREPLDATQAHAITQGLLSELAGASLRRYVGTPDAVMGSAAPLLSVYINQLQYQHARESGLHLPAHADAADPAAPVPAERRTAGGAEHERSPRSIDNEHGHGDGVGHGLPSVTGSRRAVPGEARALEAGRESTGGSDTPTFRRSISKTGEPAGTTAGDVYHDVGMFKGKGFDDILTGLRGILETEEIRGGSHKGGQVSQNAGPTNWEDAKITIRIGATPDELARRGPLGTDRETTNQFNWYCTGAPGAPIDISGKRLEIIINGATREEIATHLRRAHEVVEAVKVARAADGREPLDIHVRTVEDFLLKDRFHELAKALPEEVRAQFLEGLARSPLDAQKAVGEIAAYMTPHEFRAAFETWPSVLEQAKAHVAQPSPHGLGHEGPALLDKYLASKSLGEEIRLLETLRTGMSLRGENKNVELARVMDDIETHLKDGRKAPASVEVHNSAHEALDAAIRSPREPQVELSRRMHLAEAPQSDGPLVRPGASVEARINEVSARMRFPTPEEVAHAPYEHLERMFHENQRALAELVRSKGEEMPFLAMRGSSAEVAEMSLRERATVDRSGKRSENYFWVPERVGTPEQVVNDLLHAARSSRSYTVDDLTRGPSTPGPVSVYDLSALADRNGKMFGVKELPNTSSHPIYGEPAHVGEKVVDIKPDKFGGMYKGAIAQESFGASLSSESVQHSVEKYARAHMSGAFGDQAIALEALRLGIGVDVTRAAERPAAFALEQPKSVAVGGESATICGVAVRDGRAVVLVDSPSGPVEHRRLTDAFNYAVEHGDARGRGRAFAGNADAITRADAISRAMDRLSPEKLSEHVQTFEQSRKFEADRLLTGIERKPLDVFERAKLHEAEAALLAGDAARLRAAIAGLDATNGLHCQFNRVATELERDMSRFGIKVEHKIFDGGGSVTFAGAGTSLTLGTKALSAPAPDPVHAVWQLSGELGRNLVHNCDRIEQIQRIEAANMARFESRVQENQRFEEVREARAAAAKEEVARLREEGRLEEALRVEHEQKVRAEVEKVESDRRVKEESVYETQVFARRKRLAAQSELLAHGIVESELPLTSLTRDDDSFTQAVEMAKQQRARYAEPDPSKRSADAEPVDSDARAAAETARAKGAPLAEDALLYTLPKEKSVQTGEGKLSIVGVSEHEGRIEVLVRRGDKVSVHERLGELLKYGVERGAEGRDHGLDLRSDSRLKADAMTRALDGISEHDLAVHLRGYENAREHVGAKLVRQTTEKTNLSPAERELLRSLESALVRGDLESFKTTVGELSTGDHSVENASQFERVMNELSRDLTAMGIDVTHGVDKQVSGDKEIMVGTARLVMDGRTMTLNTENFVSAELRGMNNPSEAFRVMSSEGLKNAVRVEDRVNYLVDGVKRNNEAAAELQARLKSTRQDFELSQEQLAQRISELERSNQPDRVRAAREALRVSEAHFEVEQKRLSEKIERRRAVANLMGIEAATLKGDFPAGEYFVCTADGRSQKLLVNTDVRYDVAGSERIVGRKFGTQGDVPAYAVDAVIKALENQKVYPDVVNVLRDPGNDAAAMFRHGGTSKAGHPVYEIDIYTGHQGTERIHLSYDHETGHLIDFTRGRTLELQRQLANAYRGALIRHPKFTELLTLSGGNVEKLLDTMTHQRVHRAPRLDAHTSLTENAFKLQQYYMSQSELFAEMHKMYRASREIESREGRKPTYGELVERTVQHDTTRQDVMRGFQRYYEKLSKLEFDRVYQAEPNRNDPAFRVQRLSELAERARVEGRFEKAAALEHEAGLAVAHQARKLAAELGVPERLFDASHIHVINSSPASQRFEANPHQIVVDARGNQPLSRLSEEVRRVGRANERELARMEQLGRSNNTLKQVAEELRHADRSGSAVERAEHILRARSAAEKLVAEFVVPASRSRDIAAFLVNNRLVTVDALSPQWLQSLQHRTLLERTVSGIKELISRGDTLAGIKESLTSGRDTAAGAPGADVVVGHSVERTLANLRAAAAEGAGQPTINPPTHNDVPAISQVTRIDKGDTRSLRILDLSGIKPGFAHDTDAKAAFARQAAEFRRNLKRRAGEDIDFNLRLPRNLSQTDGELLTNIFVREVYLGRNDGDNAIFELSNPTVAPKALERPSRGAESVEGALPSLVGKVEKPAEKPPSIKELRSTDLDVQNDSLGPDAVKRSQRILDVRGVNEGFAGDRAAQAAFRAHAAEFARSVRRTPSETVEWQLYLPQNLHPADAGLANEIFREEVSLKRGKYGDNSSPELIKPVSEPREASPEDGSNGSSHARMTPGKGGMERDSGRGAIMESAPLGAGHGADYARDRIGVLDRRGQPADGAGRVAGSYRIQGREVITAQTFDVAQPGKYLAGGRTEVMVTGTGADVRLLGDARGEYHKGALGSVSERASAVLHDNCRADFVDQSVGELHDQARALVFERARVTADGDAFVDVPVTANIDSRPEIILSERAQADVRNSASLVVHGPDACAVIHHRATNVDVELRGGIAQVFEAEARVRGGGYIHVTSESRVEVSVPLGERLHVSISDGQPEMHLSRDSRGLVEVELQPGASMPAALDGNPNVVLFDGNNQPSPARPNSALPPLAASDVSGLHDSDVSGLHGTVFASPEMMRLVREMQQKKAPTYTLNGEYKVFGEQPLKIGRAADADIHVAFNCSREHAWLRWDKNTNQLLIKDTSLNGTYLEQPNGTYERIESHREVVVKPGQGIRFSMYCDGAAEMRLTAPELHQPGRNGDSLLFDGRPIELNERNQLVVGRDVRMADGNLFTTDGFVSRRHGTVTFDPQQQKYEYEDHSTRGTWVRRFEDRVRNLDKWQYVHEAKIAIEPGDEIRLVHKDGLEVSIISDRTRVKEAAAHAEAQVYVGDYRVPLPESGGPLHLGRNHRLGERGPFVEDGRVSGEHGKLFYDAANKRFLLEDTSRNGTFVRREGELDFEEVHKRTVEIRPGDEVRLGSADGPILDVFHADGPAREKQIVYIDGQPVTDKLVDAGISIGSDFQSFGKRDVINAQVSRHHGDLVFHLERSSFEYTDHSSNGTFIKRAGSQEFEFVHHAKVSLLPGDEIRLGNECGPEIKLTTQRGRDLPGGGAVFASPNSQSVLHERRWIHDDLIGIKRVQSRDHITEIYDALGRSASFGYIGEYLTSVNWSDGTTWQTKNGISWTLRTPGQPETTWRGKLTVEPDGSLRNHDGLGLPEIHRLDGSVEVLHRNGRVEYSYVDGAIERSRLSQRIERSLGAEAQRARFSDLMGEFERRPLSEQQKAETYHHVNRLLTAGAESILTYPERLRLAEQIMLQAAYPRSIDQGQNCTCNVTTVEHRVYALQPQEAARLVADIAITGKYTTADGKVVDLNRVGGIRPDSEARVSLDEPFRGRDHFGDLKHDGDRTWASQLFQMAAVNLHWMQRGRQKYHLGPNDIIAYTKERPIDRRDTGERLIKFTADGQSVLTRQVIEQSPSLGYDCLTGIYNQIVPGKDPVGNLLAGFDGGFVVVSEERARPYNERGGAVVVADREQFVEMLLKAHEEGKLPAIVSVHTDHPPFGDPLQAGSGGWHVVNIQSIERSWLTAGGYKIEFTNQWGSAQDHLGDNAVSVKTMWKAMQPPKGDAVAEGEAAIDRARFFNYPGALRQVENRLSSSGEASALKSTLHAELQRLSEPERNAVVEGLSRITNASSVVERLTDLRQAVALRDSALLPVDVHMFANVEVKPALRKEYMDLLHRAAGLDAELIGLSPAQVDALKADMAKRVAEYNQLGRMELFGPDPQRQKQMADAAEHCAAKAKEVADAIDVLKAGKLQPAQVRDLLDLLRIGGDHSDVVIPVKPLFENGGAHPLGVEWYKALIEQSTFDSAITERRAGFRYETETSKAVQRALAANDGSNGLPEGWVFVAAGHNSAADGMGIDGALLNVRENPPRIVPLDFANSDGRLAEKVLGLTIDGGIIRNIKGESGGRWALFMPSIANDAAVQTQIANYLAGKAPNPDQLTSDLRHNLGVRDPGAREAMLNNLRDWLALHVADVDEMNEVRLLEAARTFATTGGRGRVSFLVTDFSGVGSQLAGNGFPLRGLPFPSFRAILTEPEANALRVQTTPREIDTIRNRAQARCEDTSLPPHMRDAYGHFAYRADVSHDFRLGEFNLAQPIAISLGHAIDVQTGVEANLVPKWNATAGRLVHEDTGSYIEFERRIDLKDRRSGSTVVESLRVYEDGRVVGVAPRSRGRQVEIGNIRELLGRTGENSHGTRAEQAAELQSKLPRRGRVFNLSGTDAAAVMGRSENLALRLIAEACNSPGNLTGRATDSLARTSIAQQISADHAARGVAVSYVDTLQLVQKTMAMRAHVADRRVTPQQALRLEAARDAHSLNPAELGRFHRLSLDAAHEGKSDADLAKLAKEGPDGSGGPGGGPGSPGGGPGGFHRPPAGPSQSGARTGGPDRPVQQPARDSGRSDTPFSDRLRSGDGAAEAKARAVAGGERSALRRGEDVWNEKQIRNPALEEVLPKLRKAHEIEQLFLRMDLGQEYTWAVPNKEALIAIYDFAAGRGIVEVGAGNGYWASMLRQMGLDVLAYDAHPLELGSGNPYHIGKSYTEIKLGGTEVAAQHPDRVLLLGYPTPGEPVGADALKQFMAAGGEQFVYVGSRYSPDVDPRDIMMGDAEFHRILDRDWVLKHKVDLPGIPYGGGDTTDSAWFYERRTSAKPADRIGAGESTQDRAPQTRAKTAERVAPPTEGAKDNAMSAREAERPVHPAEAGAGRDSVLNYDQAAPVVFRDDAGARSHFSRGFAMAERDGGATVIRFHEHQQSLSVAGTVFQPGTNHVPLSPADNAGTTYYFDRGSGRVMHVLPNADGQLIARPLETEVTTLSAGQLNRITPAVRQEPQLTVALGDRSVDVAARGRRGIVIGSGERADLRLSGNSDGAYGTIHTDGKNFIVRALRSDINVIHENGEVTPVPAGQRLTLRRGDQLQVEGQQVSLKLGTRERYTLLPMRDTATPHESVARAVDMKMTSTVRDIPDGFAYFETVNGVNADGTDFHYRLPSRIFNAQLDPVLAHFEHAVQERFAHLLNNPPELMRQLTAYVHDYMTPHQSSEMGDGRGLRQARGIDRVADNVDANVTGPLMIGELIARGSAVCLDQAMLTNYLARRMGMETEVVSGTRNDIGHAWVRLRNGRGGDHLIFDPRNHNALTVRDRTGIPEHQQYSYVQRETQRPVLGQTDGWTGARVSSGDSSHSSTRLRSGDTSSLELAIHQALQQQQERFESARQSGTLLVATTGNGKRLHMVRAEEAGSFPTAMGRVKYKSGDWICSVDYDSASGKAGERFAAMTDGQRKAYLHGADEQSAEIFAAIDQTMKTAESTTRPAERLEKKAEVPSSGRQVELPTPWLEYVKTEPVKAEQLQEPTVWFNTIGVRVEDREARLGLPGDRKIFEKDGINWYVATKDGFEKNYAPNPGFPDEYLKLATVKAQVADRAGSIPNSDYSFKEGDYIVLKPNGDHYSVPKAEFEQLYGLAAPPDRVVERLRMPAPTGAAVARPDLGQGVSSYRWLHGEVIRDQKRYTTTVTNEHTHEFKTYSIEDGRLVLSSSRIGDTQMTTAIAYDVAPRLANTRPAQEILAELYAPGSVYRQLQEIAQAQPSTAQINTPERLRLRQEIEEKLYAEAVAHAEKGGHVTVMIGPPAAGKSSAVRAVEARLGRAAEVDPDIVKQMFPEYHVKSDMPGLKVDNGLGALAVRKESNTIKDHLLKRLLDEGYNVIIPTVGLELAATEKLLKDAKAKGFKTNLVLVDTPVHDAISNARLRFERDGRYVDFQFIGTFGERPGVNFAELKKLGAQEGYLDGFMHVWNQDFVGRVVEEGKSASGLDYNAGLKQHLDAAAAAENRRQRESIREMLGLEFHDDTMERTTHDGTNTKDQPTTVAENAKS